MSKLLFNYSTKTFRPEFQHHILGMGCVFIVVILMVSGVERDIMSSGLLTLPLRTLAFVLITIGIARPGRFGWYGVVLLAGGIFLHPEEPAGLRLAALAVLIGVLRPTGRARFPGWRS